jgi:hypothetical protein
MRNVRVADPLKFKALVWFLAKITSTLETPHGRSFKGVLEKLSRATDDFVCA